MKRSKSRKKGKLDATFKFENHKKMFVFIGGIALIILGIIGGLQLNNQKETLSAHPANTIVLDNGLATEYTVPVDATTLIESRLTSDTNYNGYLQNNGYVLNSTKVNIKGYSTIQPMQSMPYSVRTSKNRILAVGKVLTWNTGVSHSLSESFAFLLDENNNLLDSKSTKGNSVNDTTGYEGADYEVTFLKALPDGTYNMLAGTKIYNIQLNAAETSITNIVAKSIVFSGSAPTDMHYNSVEIGLDNVTYYSGHWYQSNETTSTLANGRLVALIDSNGTETSRMRFKYIPCSTIYGSDANYMRISRLSTCDTAPTGAKYTGLMSFKGQVAGTYYRIVSWDANGNIVNSYNPAIETNEIKSLDAISTLDTRYFIVKKSTETEIVKFSSGTGAFTVEATFPANTDFEIVNVSDGSYNMIGFVETVSGVFSPYSSTVAANSTYVANMDNNFNINSMSGVKTGLNSVLSISSAAELDNQRYFFTAQFSENNPSNIPADSFIDSVLSTLGTSNTWVSKAANANKFDQNAFGVFQLENDYHPALKATDDIVVDSTDKDFSTISGKNNSYWTVLDNWLITGTKNGLLADAESVKLYDVYDIELSLSPQTVSWLYTRLNQNPFNLASGIDWGKFGYDETKRGPQLVTYFVADSQNQASTVSRWANTTTPQTVIEDDYALDAQNFHVPLSSVATDIPDEEAFKELAKTLAWHMDGVHTVHEDGEAGSFDHSRVTVDTAQLTALQNADEAKPYPVDVTYTPTAGVTVVNRVWVFVTTKNTVPNNEAIYTEVTPDDTNGVVYYADDYTIPLRIAKTHTVQNVLDRGNIKVYDYYDSSHETDADCDYDAATGAYNLPTLADASKNTSRLDITNMTVITGATGACVVQPDVTYVWLEASSSTYHTQNTVTHGTLDVTITADVLLHVRQVIYNDHQDVVIPSEGYLTFANTAANTMAATVPSGKETGTMATEPGFDTFACAIDNLGGNNLLEVLVTVPEYYEYKGYYVTDFDTTHHSSSLISGTYQYDFTSGVYEKWVTVYLTPKLNSSDLPQPYSWDYKLNEFGEIETD